MYPDWAVPATFGFASGSGSPFSRCEMTGAPTTTSESGVVSVTAPSEFDTVTTARTREPRSASESAYWLVPPHGAAEVQVARTPLGDRVRRERRVGIDRDAGVDAPDGRAPLPQVGDRERRTTLGAEAAPQPDVAVSWLRSCPDRGQPFPLSAGQAVRGGGEVDGGGLHDCRREGSRWRAPWRRRCCRRSP